MKWRKLGLVYAPDGSLPWARSHAMVPTPLLRGDVIRLYVAMCDADMVGRVGYVDVSARDPRRVLYVAPRPVLDIGEPGCFDDNGVNALSVLERGDEIWMYYVGYQLGVKVRYLLFTGLAVSRDGGESFLRDRRVPVLDRSDRETLVRSSAFVRRSEAGYRMWYVASDRFVTAGDRLRPTYDIRLISSEDGRRWPDEGEVVLALDDPRVFGFARPWVLDYGGGLRMWYSVRWHDRGYRLGMADSSDGLMWERRDHDVGLDVSEAGWDSQAVCYSAVLPTPHATYMFYNGNDYGRTGFGVAILED